MQPFPLPTLVPLIGIHIPIYDLSQQVYANPMAFLDTLGFISDNSTKVQTITLWMIILASLFMLAALISFCVVKAKKGQQDNKNSEVMQGEEGENLIEWFTI